MLLQVVAACPHACGDGQGCGFKRIPGKDWRSRQSIACCCDTCNMLCNNAPTRVIALVILLVIFVIVIVIVAR